MKWYNYIDKYQYVGGSGMHKKEASYLFKALSDESRVKIVKKLYHNEELCACKILEFVDCLQPTLSHHLSILVDSGLLYSRKDGKWTYYKANKEMIDELMAFIKTPCKCEEE